MADWKLQFLLLICCVNNVLCIVSSQRKDWEYTTKAFTFRGEECVSDCKFSQCVVNFNGDMRACYTTDELPFVFYTSRVVDHNSTQCKSNCGYFGMEYQWCITRNGVFDYCNSSPESPTKISVWNYTCNGPCQYDATQNHYRCFLREGLYAFCAPPASIRLKLENADDLKTSDKENPQVIEKPVTQKCEDTKEQPNQKQCNCDRKYNAEYNNKDIYFKIEANIPHELINKIQGNQYHFTINFDSKTREEITKPGREDNSEQTEQTTDTQDNLPSTKPDENVSETSTTDNKVKQESDEISEDMWRSQLNKV